MLRYDRIAAYRGGDVLRLLSKSVVDCNNCGKGMQHMGVVLRGGYSLRRLLFVGVSVKESRCVGVAVSGSCNYCE